MVPKDLKKEIKNTTSLTRKEKLLKKGFFLNVVRKCWVFGKFYVSFLGKLNDHRNIKLFSCRISKSVIIAVRRLSEIELPYLIAPKGKGEKKLE